MIYFFDVIKILFVFIWQYNFCGSDQYVNNVGTNIRKPMVELTAQEFSTQMSTNFESVFHICQLAHPFLKASKTGSVVFTSSVSGFVSLKSMTLQGATKGKFWNFLWYNVCFFDESLWQFCVVNLLLGAINQLTKNLACEWAKDGIRSNAVAPWYIKTSMVEQVSFCLIPLHMAIPTHILMNGLIRVMLILNSSNGSNR